MLDNSKQFVELNITKLESHAKFTIKAIAGGLAQIKVTDAQGKQALVSLNITAPSALVVSKSDITLGAVQGTEEITVTAGNGDYKVLVTNPFVAKASVKGDVVTIK
ncbi:MAG: hypothetical protein EOP49_20610, partial [Sphingobacteriales bacterium]